jgi:hypothetical protein
MNIFSLTVPRMTDYWLSKLFFDLQNPAAAAEFRADRETVLGRYPLAPEVRQAVLDDNVVYLAQRTNAYLLRYFFFATGMPEEEFVARLRDG